MKKIALLFVLLFTSLTFTFSFGCSSLCVYKTYAHSENFKAGNATFNASEIKKVDITWYYGEIIINSTSDEQVSINESSSTLQDDQRVHYYLENNLLTIHFCKSGFNGTIDNNKKRVTISIPNDIELIISSRSAQISSSSLVLSNFSISSASGEIDANSIIANDCSITSQSGDVSIDSIKIENDLSINSQSGEISVDNLTATNVAINSQSGDLELENVDAKKLDIDTKSGEINLKLISCNESAITSSSGDVEITLLNNLGAKLKLTQSSGRLKCNKDYSTSNGYIVIGNGDCLLTITTASGDVEID